MKHALLVAISFLLLSIAPAAAQADDDRGARFQNLDQMIEELNLRPYFRSRVQPHRQLKIAILDNGFRYAEEEIGNSLPANTQIHRGPVAVPGEEETHGFYMARILWSLLSLGGKDERYAPAELHLYQTFGYSNFKFAVEDSIQRGVDIILYSQTWEYGGNFDGKGFINSLVSKATDAGILWINNAGNFGNTTFNSNVKKAADGWLDLPGANESVEIRCEQNTVGNCKLRAVLSWNDFSDDVEEGTDKDLDFVLTDDTLAILQSSNLTQKRDTSDGLPGASKYPREIITAELKPGLYFLRVKNRSNNFTARDRIRITVSGDFVNMSGSDPSESLLNPADHPDVITVGAADSERSSRSIRLRKPEIYANSLVSLTKKENFKGTSNSAAMVVAGAAILLSLDPSLTKAEILRQVSTAQGGGAGERGRGLPLEQLGFQPDSGRGCFTPVAVEENFPGFVREMVGQGGTLVSTTAGWKVFFPMDPIHLLPGVFRRLPNDILVYGIAGAGVYHRSGLLQMPSDMVEVLETPSGARVCGSESANLPAGAKFFRLPGRSAN